MELWPVAHAQLAVKCAEPKEAARSSGQLNSEGSAEPGRPDRSCTAYRWDRAAPVTICRPRRVPRKKKAIPEIFACTDREGCSAVGYPAGRTAPEDAAAHFVERLY